TQLGTQVGASLAFVCRLTLDLLQRVGQRAVLNGQGYNERHSAKHPTTEIQFRARAEADPAQTSCQYRRLQQIDRGAEYVGQPCRNSSRLSYPGRVARGANRCQARRCGHPTQDWAGQEYESTKFGDCPHVRLTPNATNRVDLCSSIRVA